jgi:hypothetical protein
MQRASSERCSIHGTLVRFLSWMRHGCTACNRRIALGARTARAARRTAVSACVWCRSTLPCRPGSGAQDGLQAAWAGLAKPRSPTTAPPSPGADVVQSQRRSCRVSDSDLACTLAVLGAEKATPPHCQARPFSKGGAPGTPTDGTEARTWELAIDAGHEAYQVRSLRAFPCRRRRPRRGCLRFLLRAILHRHAWVLVQKQPIIGARPHWLPFTRRYCVACLRWRGWRCCVRARATLPDFTRKSSSFCRRVSPICARCVRAGPGRAGPP